jgi:hypothetical protein
MIQLLRTNKISTGDATMTLMKTMKTLMIPRKYPASNPKAHSKKTIRAKVEKTKRKSLGSQTVMRKKIINFRLSTASLISLCLSHMTSGD